MSHDICPERASELLLDLLNVVDDGCHTLVLSVAGHSRTIPFHTLGDALMLDVEDAVSAAAVLALLPGRIGGAVIRTAQDNGTSRVIGWRLKGYDTHPLNEAEIFNAYCTDPVTGEPVPPQWGTEYAAAPPVGG
ncbi:hypothetical protein [Streptomyces sp. NPDC053720]|uniref:hypothetical protein n=1 Tax=Streptomyces sp. NPDC053720 TaxID=3154855 RepID=UPI00343CCACD